MGKQYLDLDGVNQLWQAITARDNSLSAEIADLSAKVAVVVSWENLSGFVNPIEDTIITSGDKEIVVPSTDNEHIVTPSAVSEYVNSKGLYFSNGQLRFGTPRD